MMKLYHDFYTNSIYLYLYYALTKIRLFYKIILYSTKNSQYLAAFLFYIITIFIEIANKKVRQSPNLI